MHHNVIKKVQVCGIATKYTFTQKYIATFFLAGWIFLPASEIFTDQVCRMPSAGNIFDTHRETSGASSPERCPYKGDYKEYLQCTALFVFIVFSALYGGEPKTDRAFAD